MRRVSWARVGGTDARPEGVVATCHLMCIIVVEMQQVAHDVMDADQEQEGGVAISSVGPCLYVRS